jgi:hypothetical protein
MARIDLLFIEATSNRVNRPIKFPQFHPGGNEVAWIYSHGSAGIISITGYDEFLNWYYQHIF